MKTFNAFSKFFAYALVFSMVFLYSCKDKDAAEPSMADQVTGSYNVTSISQGGIVVTLPAQGVSGEYSVSKINDSKVKVSYVLKSAGYPDEVGSEDATLTKGSNGGIDFHTSAKVGNFMNNTITFDFEDENGAITIVAKKK
ncbi:hypothetical protein [Emticicia fontis]